VLCSKCFAIEFSFPSVCPSVYNFVSWVNRGLLQDLFISPDRSGTGLVVKKTAKNIRSHFFIGSSYVKESSFCISLYLRNDTGHSYCGMPLGTHILSIKWCHFQWPRMTSNLDWTWYSSTSNNSKMVQDRAILTTADWLEVIWCVEICHYLTYNVSETVLDGDIVTMEY